jgi:tRNA/tmRNA/rRNA uracil-C5-methylase (TrmA/RlmC/RlmD family)
VAAEELGRRRGAERTGRGSKPAPRCSGRVGGRALTAKGQLLELEIGAVAHGGGHCVSRYEGRVVFVRHTLPGERVRAVVTDGEESSSFWRADAVEVLQPSPDRVPRPCPWAGPGRCGGCDWQHVAVPAQRELKAAVVREQLQHLAGLDVPVVVEAVPGDDEGLGWRTRVHFAVDDNGRAGLRRHRSHEVQLIDRCRIAHPLVDRAAVTSSRWPGRQGVDVSVAVSSGETVVLPDGQPVAGEPASVTEHVHGRAYRVSGGGFWQVHPGAASTLVDAVVQGLDPRAGERVLDLYAGVGLFAAALADRVAPGGRVTAVEASLSAVADARHNLAGLPGVRVESGRVDHALRRRGLGRADLVVLDPPRTGAGKQVVAALGTIRPRRIAYVACDPAALARDLKWFAARGYALDSLRAFDLFPMTAHIECVAVLVRASS